MNKLLILTAHDHEDDFVSQLKTPGIQKIFICPIDYGCQKKVENLKSILKDINCAYEVVDFLEVFNRNAFQYRDEYLNFIHDLGLRKPDGQETLRGYFQYPQQKFSLWWFSLIVEKGPHKTEVFTYFIRTFTILKLKKRHACDEILMTPHAGYCYQALFPAHCRAAVRRATFKAIAIEFLKVLKQSAILLKRITELKWVFPDSASRKNTLQSGQLFSVTSFPFIDLKALDEGRFVNKAYAVFQNALERNHDGKIVWLAMFASFNGYQWKDTVRFMKGLRDNGVHLFFLDEWLGWRDFGCILKIYFSIVIRFFKKIKMIAQLFEFRHPDIDGAIDLWPILNADFCSSFMGKVLSSGIIAFETFNNIVKDVPAESKILHYAEMHVWEKALNASCWERQKIVRVGLQHSIVPLLLLNNFCHPEELKGDDLMSRMPMPNYLGCVGHITQRLFLNNGWKESDVFILGGFRYQALLRKEGAETETRSKKRHIVVAFSLSPFENIEMLRLLHDAFNNQTLNYKILLKGHPCDPLQKTIDRIGLKFNEKNFELTTRDLQEIVPESSVMMVKESSSVFWAVHHEIPVIVPNLYEIVDLCPLSGISRIPIYVNSAEKLLSVVNEIMAGKRSVDVLEYRKVMSDYLSIYPDPKQYYDNFYQAVNKLADNRETITLSLT